MNSSRIIRGALLAAVVATTVPTMAHAQLGGALRAARNKVKDGVEQAVTGSASTGSQGGASQSGGSSPGAGGGTRSSEVLEITPEVLDRLEKGLAAESAERAEVARFLASLTTPEQYSACQTQAVQSPESQALLERFQAEMEKHENDPQALQKLLLKQSEAVQALFERKCGADPSSQGEVRKAAQARPEAAGARAGGFTIDNQRHWGQQMVSREYAILKERIAPFCRNPQQTGKYAYTAAEQEALRPRCETLSRALAETL
jgi:hypothetical protein